MRTKEELERLYKRVERWGKLAPEERERRVRIWRHNSLLGHVAMARSNMRAIETVSTTSARAREIAGQIWICWVTWTKNSGRTALTRNKLVSVGYLGSKRVYLNVPREEAIRRWEASEGEKFIEGNIELDEFEFNDEFYAYDVGAPYEG